MNLTQYLESQENQDMTKLLHFLELKRGEEKCFFVCLQMKEMGGLYSSGGGNMNRRPFNKG